MATSVGPEFSFYYADTKDKIVNPNSDITDGTFWFCDEDRTLGIKMNNSVKEFAKPRVLIDNRVNNSQGFLDCIRIVSSNTEIEKTSSENVLYFIIDERAISMVMNNPITNSYRYPG